MRLEDKVLDKITPGRKQTREMEGVVADLEATLDDALAGARLPGKARVQGSVAKGTWLSGSTDIDCFLLLDPSVSEERLKAAAEQIGPEVLEDVQRKYAQHPYLVGRFRDHDVDLVPAYAVAEATDKMSAVDRTPFHTAWVAANLDDAGRDQVRLLKQWCKGTGVYGAETAIGGFSGYLLEVLIAVFADFRGVLDWLASGPQNRRIALGDDQVDDDVSPLVVVDPVDPSRNCAAAVRPEVLALAREAALAYLDDPSDRFFFPAEAKAAVSRLGTALEDQGARWLAILLPPATDRLDIVFPQFQKAARQIGDELGRQGWPIIRSQVDADDDGSAVLLQWLVEDRVLGPQRVQQGPPGDSKHAARFRDKWDGHPDAAGPVDEHDGRLQVAVHVRDRQAHEYLHRHAEKLLAAKHVQAAWRNGGRILDDPMEVPDPWPPIAADLVLDRRPWQR